MDYFGLNSPDELPKLKEIFAENIVQPTIIRDLTDQPAEEPSGEDESPEHRQDDETAEEYSSTSLMSVSESGELVEDNDHPQE